MTIRTGIGGWVYEPWRETFYPKGTKQADELAYASRQVRAIEINATFYSRQKPESFAKWRDATPEGFVFALKGSRFVSNRRNLAEAGEGVQNFVAQGLTELGDKLGPIFWQLAKTKTFDAEEIAAFFALLPREHDGLGLRHAIEVGHDSFACAEFTELAQKAGVAIVYSEEEARPAIDANTAGFRYARLQGMQSEIETGYPDEDLDRLAALCRRWDSEGSDVFCFLINGAKERAPAAAMALAERLF
ncbi:MAG: DUF72 domain-containing protein [Novosphingobium sp.]|nr:DUF72 domain-containing protein [Novosphingobium sp.]MBO9603962.1 DUF72 domain-containing protein [Novosphingobium sp.]